MPNDVAMISAILRKLASALDSGDHSIITNMHALVLPQRELKPSNERLSKAELKTRMDAIEHADPDELHNMFSKFESRDALESHILKTYPTKVHIVAVARKLRVHTTKSDDLDAVVNKVIDATLGYRLRQQAIRGDTVP